MRRSSQWIKMISGAIFVFICLTLSGHAKMKSTETGTGDDHVRQLDGMPARGESSGRDPFTDEFGWVSGEGLSDEEKRYRKMYEDYLEEPIYPKRSYEEWLRMKKYFEEREKEKGREKRVETVVEETTETKAEKSPLTEAYEVLLPKKFHYHKGRRGRCKCEAGADK